MLFNYLSMAFFSSLNIFSIGALKFFSNSNIWATSKRQFPFTPVFPCVCDTV